MKPTPQLTTLFQPYERPWSRIPSHFSKSNIITFIFLAPYKDKKEAQTFRLWSPKCIREIILETLDNFGKWTNPKTSKFIMKAGVDTNVLSKNINNPVFIFVFSSHFCEIKVQTFISNSCSGFCQHENVKEVKIFSVILYFEKFRELKISISSLYPLFSLSYDLVLNSILFSPCSILSQLLIY